MSAKTITNFCNNLSIYCLNHDEPILMEVVNNTEVIKTPFFACANYLPSETNAEPCKNRLNLDDYLGIVDKFVEIVSEGDFMADYTNFEFTYRGARQKIFVKCLLYSNKEVRLGIKNQTVLGK